MNIKRREEKLTKEEDELADRMLKNPLWRGIGAVALAIVADKFKPKLLPKIKMELYKGVMNMFEMDKNDIKEAIDIFEILKNRTREDKNEQ